MKVYIVGKTEARLFHRVDKSENPYGMPGKAFGSKFGERHVRTPGKGFGKDKPYEPEALLEFAGRLCYESFDMPNPDTATRDGYLSNIIELGHESVLEHASISFYVEGVSRNLSHELIRHRHLSFSELSQRYVDMEDANFVVPPAARNEALGVGPLCPLSDYAFDEVSGDPKQMYNDMVNQVKSDDKTRKQAREAARSYLPSGMETKFVVTGNLRAWRDVLKKRDSKYADAEMQLFAKEVKRQLFVEFPDVFADLVE